jgi:solute:Na+ symporter, SSS family
MASSATMTMLDWSIVGIYTLVIIGIGLMVSKRQASTEDFFLASRSTTWPVIGLALLASNISSTTIVGLAGAAYSTGIAVYNYEWMATIVLVFFCLFFLPFLLRAGVYTLPEFLQRRYNGFARTYFSGLTLFLNIVVDTSAALYGGALMFKLVFPHVPLWQIVLVLALSAGIYTIAGGLKAVIYTEVIQAVVLLSASIFIAWFSFEAAGGWDKVMSSVPAEKLSLIRPIHDPNLPWLGLVVGVPLLGFYFWCTNQFMTQRVLSAKNENHGRWGSLFAGLLKLPLLWLMVLPGTAAILIYPDLPKGDMVYPTLLFDLLPHGVIGLVVAGFLAALMSSIASTFNSASTLFTMDFVRRWKPDISNSALVTVGRLTTVVFMILAVLWAPQIEKFESLWQYLQAVLAYAVPPVVALYLVGLFWTRANSFGATLCIITGLSAGIALFLAVVVFGAVELHFLYVAPILFVLSLAALILGSLMKREELSDDARALHWTPAFYRDETAVLQTMPWWQNYRIQSVALIGLTAAIVWAFR